MSEPEDGSTRHVCLIFESQTWRKSLCKNCFHSLQEHSEELLAQEGQAVAKEKAAAKISGKASSDSPAAKANLQKNKAAATSTEGKNAKTPDSVKETRTSKEKSPSNTKDRMGASKDPMKTEDKLLTNDTNHENGKSVKPATSTAPKNPKGKLQTTSTSAPTSSTSSLTTSSKSSLKTLTPSPTTTSPTTTINSSTTAISDKSITPDTLKPLASKTKNVASKFESKTSISSKEKPITSPDNRSGNSASSSNSSKPIDDSSDTKPSNKPQLEKTPDEPKTISNKIDQKSSGKTAEEFPLANGISKSTKTAVGKMADTKATKNEKSRIDSHKDNKPSTAATKNESQDLKLATSRSKPAPAAKDTLNGLKRITKQSKSSPEPDDRSQLSKVKEEGTTKSRESLKTGAPKSPEPTGGIKDSVTPNLKSPLGKVNETKGKQPEEEPSSKTFTKSKSPDLTPEAHTNVKIASNAVRLARSSENLESTTSTKPGFLTRSTGKISDSKAADNSADKTKTFKGRIGAKKESSPVPDLIKTDSEKSAGSKDREKQKADGNATVKKTDTTSSSFSNGAGSKLTSATSPLSKTTTASSSLTDSKLSPLNPLSKTAEGRSQKNLSKLDNGKDSKSTPKSLEKFKSLENKSDKIDDKHVLQSPIKSPLGFPSQAPKPKENLNDKTTKEELKSTAKVESKDSPKEDSKVAVKEESKIKTKFDSKDKGKAELIGSSKDEPKGKMNIEAQNKTKGDVKEKTKPGFADKPKVESKDVTKIEPSDKLKGKIKVEPQEKPKVELHDKAKVELNEKSKVGPHDKTKVEPRDKAKVGPHDKTKVEPHDKTKVEPRDKAKVEPHDKMKIEPRDEAKVEPHDKTKVEPHDKMKIETENQTKQSDPKTSSTTDVTDTARLQAELKGKEEKMSMLSDQLSKMEDQMKALQQERDQLKGTSLQIQRKDTEQMLNDLRTHLSTMESQCCRLERDNQSLIDKLHVQEASVKLDQECRGKNVDNVDLEEDLEAAEKELEDVKGVNKELQRQIMDMKHEMEEMYDHFRESEQDEFRELQKELDITAKNCRILQFKLRKAERLNDQIEEDRIQYEEKLRMLQDQFDSKDAKNHIRVLEEELRVAKEVSVRLHDELDLVEDKRNKALDDNRHLTDLLEHTDRRQFRLQVEIDKLRDIVSDLKYQLKEARSENKNNNNNNNKESTPDRKVHCSIYTRSSD